MQCRVALSIMLLRFVALFMMTVLQAWLQGTSCYSILSGPSTKGVFRSIEQNGYAHVELRPVRLH